MPASVVVGGQYGSEGKGKVALWLARETGATAAVRVGGANSGHTAINTDGRCFSFRHLPTALLLDDVTGYIPPGAYLDVQQLLKEIAMLSLRADRIRIDPLASIITEENRENEKLTGLAERIGSTATGTGDAVLARVRRDGSAVLARDVKPLQPFLEPITPKLRNLLGRGERIIIEGTQGFGLSLLHSPSYPFATSRDTTAAAFVAEAGLSPMDVDDVTLVIRAFPIRVGGNSGFLANETSWSEIASNVARTVREVTEYTTVTHRIRRVGRFDPELVRAAISVNAPTRVVLNHVDYIGAVQSHDFLRIAERFIKSIEQGIGTNVELIGLDRRDLYKRSTFFSSSAMELAR